MRADDDEVHVLRLGRRQDRLRRVAFPNQEGGPDAGGTGTSDENLGAALSMRARS